MNSRDMGQVLGMESNSSNSMFPSHRETGFFPILFRPYSDSEAARPAKNKESAQNPKHVQLYKHRKTLSLHDP